MTTTQYKLLSDSLKVTVTALIHNNETPEALKGVLSDFNELLKKCEDETARIRLCNRYITMYRREAQAAKA